MNTEAIAVPYARALVELASDRGELDSVREEVTTLRAILEREADLRVFVETPSIGKEQKSQALEQALRGRLSDTLVNFLLKVVGKRRELYLMGMLEEFEVVYDEAVGRVPATVTTATPLSDEQAAAIGDRLAKDLGKKVELAKDVDESLLGGFVLRYSGMVADASIRSSLDAIGERMLATEFESEIFHED
jgi:F-type H+-transporting ATPase subunit delta